MINQNDLFWLAGIIDGEGYLTTNTRNGKHKLKNGGEGSRAYVTRIGVGNTDFGIIKKLSEIYSELGVKYYYGLHNPPKDRPDSMQYISINVEGYKSCRKILEKIVDKSNSLQKKPQIELMIRYVDYRLGIMQLRGEKGQLKAKVSEEDFKNIDMHFVEELRNAKRYQIPPSTTKRIASTPLSW